MTGSRAWSSGLAGLALISAFACSRASPRRPDLPGVASAQSSTSTLGGGQLDVHVAGIPAIEGRLIIVLYDERTYLQEDAFVAKRATAVTATDMHVVLEKLAPGRYVVVVTHDANANDALDTSVIGMPTEAYGFSRDARGSFGPPSFEDGAFEFDGGSRTIAVELR